MNDLRFALHQFLKNPGFTAEAVLGSGGASISSRLTRAACPAGTDEHQSRSLRKTDVMKIRIPSLSVTAFVLACWTYPLTAQTLTPDLKAIPDGKGWKGNVSATKFLWEGWGAGHRVQQRWGRLA